MYEQLFLEYSSNRTIQPTVNWVSIELLTISSANIWRLSGLELNDILIQQ
jgi:hypothetical protein